jgi:hypothetical protein
VRTSEYDNWNGKRAPRKTTQSLDLVIPPGLNALLDLLNRRRPNLPSQVRKAYLRDFPYQDFVSQDNFSKIIKMEKLPNVYFFPHMGLGHDQYPWLFEMPLTKEGKETVLMPRLLNFTKGFKDRSQVLYRIITDMKQNKDLVAILFVRGLLVYSERREERIMLVWSIEAVGRLEICARGKFLVIKTPVSTVPAISLTRTRCTW